MGNSPGKVDSELRERENIPRKFELEFRLKELLETKELQ